MICNSCQARNNNSNLFCTSCGMRLAPPSPDQAREGASWQSSDTLPREGARGNSPDAEGLRRQGLPVERGLVPVDSPWGVPETMGVQPYARSPYGMQMDGGLAPYRPYVPHLYQGGVIQPNNIVCAQCGVPRPARLETCPYCGRTIANTSGQNDIVPAEIAGWNWGAFMFPVLWSISHETWFGLLALVPGLDIVVRFVLAARGNELAWQHRRFQSLDQFTDIQRIWRNWSIGAMGVLAAMMVVFFFAAAS